jgi:hypothetical protein
MELIAIESSWARLKLSQTGYRISLMDPDRLPYAIHHPCGVRPVGPGRGLLAGRVLIERVLPGEKAKGHRGSDGSPRTRIGPTHDPRGAVTRGV